MLVACGGGDYETDEGLDHGDISVDAGENDTADGEKDPEGEPSDGSDNGGKSPDPGEGNHGDGKGEDPGDDPGDGPGGEAYLSVHIVPNPETVRVGGVVILTAVVEGGEGEDDVSIRWEAAEGTLSDETGETVSWTAPNEVGAYRIGATVKAGGQEVASEIDIQVEAQPLAITISADRASVDAGGVVTLSATLEGTHAADATINWEASAGSLSSTTGTDVSLTAPRLRNGKLQVFATASTESEFASTDIEIDVRYSPLSIAITADRYSVDVGGVVTLSAALGGTHAADATISWVAAGGSLSSNIGPNVNWTAAVTSGGKFKITAIADTGEESHFDEVEIDVQADPLAVEIMAGPKWTTLRQDLPMTAQLAGSFTAGATIEWTAAGGELSSSHGKDVVWTAPNQLGSYEITAKATTANESVTQKIDVDVRLCDSGSEDDQNNPCIITTVYQLQAIGDHLRRHFALGGDIDASATAGWNEGKGFGPMGFVTSGFRGSLDGRGREIQGLFIDREGLTGVGLFAATSESAKIFDLRLVDVEITGGPRTGGLVGHHQGEIRNVSVSGVVQADENYVGGVVGFASPDCKVEDVRNYSDVRGADGVGGVIGASGSSSDAGGEIENLSNHGKVYGDDKVGGVIGFKIGGDVKSLFNAATGAVTGVGSVGGVVGHNNPGVIENSYNLAPIESTGGGAVGGVIGASAVSGTVRNCYNAGLLRSSGRVGGVTGSVYGEVSSSFYDMEKSGTITTTGNDGNGLSTQNMQQEVIFRAAGWDFTNIWKISPNDYPDLIHNSRY